MKKMITVTVISLIGLIIFSRFFFGVYFLDNLSAPSEVFKVSLSTSMLLYGLLTFFGFFMAVTDWRRPFAHFLNLFINLYIFLFKQHGNYRQFDEFKEKTNDTTAITGTLLGVLYIFTALYIIYQLYGLPLD